MVTPVLLLAVAALGGVGASMWSRSVRKYDGPHGEVVEEHDSWVPEIAAGGSLAILATWGALSFFGGATGLMSGGLGQIGNSGSATPTAPVVSGLAAIVVDTSTTRATYTVTAAGGSTHDSTRLVITRLTAADTLIDSIYGGAVLDKTVASNTNLKADTTYRLFVRARATNGAGWGASVVDTFVNTASAWPNNEPSGMTEIVSTDGSDKYFGTGGSGTGWFFGGRWADNTYVNQDITCSGSRYGTCVTKTLFVGDQSGFNGLAQYDWNSTVGTKRHLYFRTIFKFSSNYQICASDEKPFGYLAYQGGLNDLFMGMKSSGAWDLANQGHNSDPGSWSYVGTGTINFTMTPGDWITLEIYAVGESTSSSSDGEIHIWIDGSSHYSVTGLNYSSVSSHWRGMSLFNYWGGGCSGATAKAVQDTIFISEVYVSGKN